MPRPKQQSNSPSLSPGQATYVLERMIAERRISPGEVSRYVSDMHREISDLESRLTSLRSAAGAMSSGAAAPRRGPGRPPGRRPGRPAGSGAKAGAKRRGRPPRAAAASAGGGEAAAAPAAGRKGRKRRSAITAEQLASRQLQGRYLGLIRQIPAAKRAQYQKVAKEKGREAAIKEMQSNLGK